MYSSVTKHQSSTKLDITVSAHSAGVLKKHGRIEILRLLLEIIKLLLRYAKTAIKTNSQKICGILFIIIPVLAIKIIEAPCDITFLIMAAPLGIYLIFSKRTFFCIWFFCFGIPAYPKLFHYCFTRFSLKYYAIEFVPPDSAAEWRLLCQNI